MVAVPVQAEAWRGDFSGGGRLFEDVELGVRVHLEHAVSLVGGARYLLCEHLRSARAGPGGAGRGVAHLLSHQLVGRYFQVLAHDVAEGHPQGNVEVVEEEVEWVATDQRLDFAIRNRGRVLVVAVANQAVVGVHLDDHMLIYVAHAHAPGVIVVTRRQGNGHRDGFDVGDLHD